VQIPVSANTGADSFQHITNLFNEARADFPGLKRSDAAVVKYTEGVHRGSVSLEFKAPQTPPPEYKRVERMEHAL
jgi:hypothetical protein